MQRAMIGSPSLRYALILDTETTGLEPPPKDVAVEVAVAVFDLKHAQVVESYASLIRSDRNEAEPINGIPVELLKSAPPGALVWRHVESLAARTSVVIAHNAAFDRQFTTELGVPWVCSESGIQWPGRARAGSLINLALSLGLGVASAHRAMSDVDTLARVLTHFAGRGCNLAALVQHAMRPSAIFHAQITFSVKYLAKEHGFRWDAEKKVWWRRMAVEDAKALPFKTLRVKE